MTGEPEYLTLERPTKAYHDDWKEYELIPAGAKVLIVDKLADERGACIVVEWQGKELAINVDDLDA